MRQTPASALRPGQEKPCPQKARGLSAMLAAHSPASREESLTLYYKIMYGYPLVLTEQFARPVAQTQCLVPDTHRCQSAATSIYTRLPRPYYIHDAAMIQPSAAYYAVRM